MMIQAGANGIAYEEGASEDRAKRPKRADQASESQREPAIRLEIRIELVPERPGISSDPDAQDENPEANSGQQEIDQHSGTRDQFENHTFISSIQA
jgi:hypothetical protein